MSELRVTVVDDDHDVLALFEELFDFLDGFELTTFADALPGIEDLIASKPDLIVVDLGLAHEREELTGLQVIHTVRSTAELRDVPVIASYTAHAVMNDAWAALMERGDIHQLAKPFDLTTFERVVNMALGRSEGGLDSAHLHAIGNGQEDVGATG